MPRLRTIKPEFFKNDILCSLSPHHRLAFAGLWCWADRAGRLEDRPTRLRVEIFPYEAVDLNAILTDLARAGFIRRYEVDGSRYIQIRKFAKHQYPHKTEKSSTIPEEHHAPTSEASGEDERSTEQALLSVGSSVALSVGQLGDGGSGGKQTTPRAAPSAPSELGYQVADALRAMTLKYCPEEPRFKRPSTRDADAQESDRWAKDVPHDRQLKAIRWAEAQPPRGTFRWAANLRSVAKLRAKYADIAAQARTAKETQAPVGPRPPDPKTRENIEAERRAIEESRRLREAPQVERLVGGIFK